jgi:hypothetical protein
MFNKEEENSDFVNNFWNEVAMSQMMAGGAPSVVTKDMRKALDGDKEAAAKISSEVDMNKVRTDGRNELIRKFRKE